MRISICALDSRTRFLERLRHVYSDVCRSSALSVEKQLQPGFLRKMAAEKPRAPAVEWILGKPRDIGGFYRLQHQLGQVRVV